MGDALIVIATLELPVILGVELITLIIYPIPAAVLQGIVHVIVPAAVPVSVPIVTGAAKLPAAFDNCAVKTFPGVKVPAIAKGTLTIVHAQNGLPEIVPVVIEFATGEASVISSIATEGLFPKPPELIHLKPIFTFALLLEDTGNTCEKAAEDHCPLTTALQSLQ